MMAYLQQIPIMICLLFAIADEYKESNEELLPSTCNEEPQVDEPCCLAHRSESEVKINDIETTKINCNIDDERSKNNLYTYGNEEHGLGVFNKIMEKINQYSVPSSGGIFVCTTEEKQTVKSDYFCNSHKTFVISLKNDTHEKSDNKTTYVEGEKVILDCNFNQPYSYTLFWIVTYSSGLTKCLSSVEVERTTDNFNISKNKLCCSIEGLCQRHCQKQAPHDLYIENITTSQSGEYLCIVYFFNKGGHSWKTVTKTFIQVINKDKDITGNVISISGIIGSLAAVGAILCLVVFCIKYNGKQRQVNHSHSNRLPTEYECTPYAISVGQKNTALSNEQEPMPVTDAEYAEVDLKSLTVCSDTVYSKVCSGPQPEPISQYSYIGMEHQAEAVPGKPSSENSNDGMEPQSVYVMLGKEPLVVAKKK